MGLGFFFGWSVSRRLDCFDLERGDSREDSDSLIWKGNEWDWDSFLDGVFPEDWIVLIWKGGIREKDSDRDVTVYCVCWT